MRTKDIGAAGVGAVVGAALGFDATSGLMAMIRRLALTAVREATGLGRAGHRDRDVRKAPDNHRGNGDDGVWL